MELHTEMGQRCAEMLTRGEAVPENIVIQLIKEKIDSPEVAHHGNMDLCYTLLSRTFSSC